jgi:ribosomal protein S18 acetylase RimI-like enzyme
MATVLSGDALAAHRTLSAAAGVPAVRPATRDDLGRLLEIFQHVPEFQDPEVRCARAVLEDAFQEASTYRVLLDERGGCAIYGRTPITEGTFDLYWLAVDARSRRLGVGSDLLRIALHEMRVERGRRVRVETEDSPQSSPAHRLYERAGLAVAARLPDFYGAGRAMLLYYGRLD